MQALKPSFILAILTRLGRLTLTCMLGLMLTQIPSVRFDINFEV
jgi:hypothetical protein